MSAVLVRSAIACTVLTLQAAAASAQSPRFTAEDMLNVASITLLDVTDDGARVAATVRRPIDNDFTDHRRFGDPTYLAPSRVRLEIIECYSEARPAQSTCEDDFIECVFNIDAYPGT